MWLQIRNQSLPHGEPRREDTQVKPVRKPTREERERERGRERRKHTLTNPAVQSLNRGTLAMISPFKCIATSVPAHRYTQILVFKLFTIRKVDSRQKHTKNAGNNTKKREEECLGCGFT